MSTKLNLFPDIFWLTCENEEGFEVSSEELEENCLGSITVGHSELEQYLDQTGRTGAMYANDNDHYEAIVTYEDFIASVDAAELEDILTDYLRSKGPISIVTYNCAPFPSKPLNLEPEQHSLMLEEYKVDTRTIFE